MHALVDQSWHYIAGPGAAEELYRYREDPGEQHDFSKDPRSAEDLARLRAALRRLPFGY